MHMDAHAHTCILMHRHTHAHSCTGTHMHMHEHTHSCTYIHMNTHEHAHMHTCICTPHTWTCTHMHMHAHAHEPPPTPICTHTIIAYMHTQRGDKHSESSVLLSSFDSVLGLSSVCRPEACFSELLLRPLDFQLNWGHFHPVQLRDITGASCACTLFQDVVLAPSAVPATFF